MHTFQDYISISHSPSIQRLPFLPQHTRPNARTHTHAPWRHGSGASTSCGVAFRARARVCVFVCARACVGLCKRGRYGRSCGTAATGGIYSSAATDTCAFALVIGRSPICAAGATWTSRTTSAPWAARFLHTSVIDAAGAIYVIGGFGVSLGRDTDYNDVWVSTDGGADRTQGITGHSGVLTRT
jgi:hypothetical protein